MKKNFRKKREREEKNMRLKGFSALYIYMVLRNTFGEKKSRVKEKLELKTGI